MKKCTSKIIFKTRFLFHDMLKILKIPIAENSGKFIFISLYYSLREMPNNQSK